MARSGLRAVRGESKCVVLVPVGQRIEPACDEALRELERTGYSVRRGYGYSQIDFGRSQMASDALADGFEETLWIDADVAFDPAAVARLRSHDLPIACGVYPQKGCRSLACRVLPDCGELVFGGAGGLAEIHYAAGGFLLVRREVYRTIERELMLPTCDVVPGQSVVPYFLPLVVAEGGCQRYLSEDFSFCERARRCGYRIWADTSLRLFHVGAYGYGWEDAGAGAARYASYRFAVVDSMAGPAR